MKHPTSEDWTLYLSDEVPPEQRAVFAEHLRDCRICAADCAAIERTAKRLRDWEFPAHVPARAPWAAPMLKWSVAAALVLGAGFAWGRFSAPPAADLETMRSELQISIKASLAIDFQKALDRTQAQSAEALAALEARLSAASDEQVNRVVHNVVAAVNTVREEDRQMIRGQLAEARRQHEADVRWLRQDLETLASRAGDEIQLAQLKLRQLSVKPEKTNP
jgi:hypothetical protein